LGEQGGANGIDLRNSSSKESAINFMTDKPSKIDRPGTIAILGTRGIPARYGGFETFAEHLSVGLVERGWKVEVYCESGDLQRTSPYKGVHLIEVPTFSLGPLRTIFFDISCLWHARKSKFIYMLGYGTALFCFLPRLWNAHVLINMDGLEWRRSKFNAFGRLYLKMMEYFATKTANRLIADAEGIRSYLASSYRGLPPTDVIAYGAEIVNTPSRAPLQTWDLQPLSYLLVVARLEPENHILEIIDGYVASESKFPLIIVGDNKTKTKYVSKLHTFKSKNVRFIGAIHDKILLESLRYYATAYIHGHSVGGTNPSLLEAMGCGNFIIAHDNPFNREVTGGNAVFFSQPGDLAVLLRNWNFFDETTEKFKDACKERIISSYSWKKIVDSYERLFLNLEKNN
jgi:glycosyltransferase involved in cell wall biosynthesis